VFRNFPWWCPEEKFVHHHHAYVKHDFEEKGKVWEGSLFREGSYF